MTNNSSSDKIKQLELELKAKNTKISNLLDKIDTLEDSVMKLEKILTTDSNKKEISLYKFQLDELERKNREIKDKLSHLRLENVKLKQNLKKLKNKRGLNSSLIKLERSHSLSDEIKEKKDKKTREEEDFSQKDQYRKLHIKCPECETQKILKVPLKIVSQTKESIIINIPREIVCEHEFQVYIDKHFNIERYNVVDFEFHKIEYLESGNLEELRSEQETSFEMISPIFQDVLKILRDCLDDPDIIGNAIFSLGGKLLYASIPPHILFNVIKEFEIRRGKNLKNLTRMFLELKDHQKICSEYIEIKGINFILVLIFSKKVNFGMGSMLLRDVGKTLQNLS